MNALFISLEKFDRPPPAILLPCLWAISTTLSEGRWPDKAVLSADAANAAANAANAANAADAADAADAAYAAAGFDAATVAAAYAAALKADTQAIDKGGTTQDLLGAVLWPNITSKSGQHIAMPADLYDDWQSLKSQLLGLNQNWRVWTDWYEDRLRGGVALIEAIEIGNPENGDYGRVTFPKDWYTDPAKLNAALKDKIDKYWAGQSQSQNDDVPPIGFASIRTKWRGGKLFIDTSVVDPDLEAKLAIANLMALKDEMLNFADKLGKSQRNYDDSYLDLFKDFATLIDNTLPDSRLVFRLMKKETILLALEKIILEQWPDPMAAQYSALCTEITDALDMFPDIRAFKRQQANAEMEVYSDEEVKNDIDLRLNIMRSERGQEIITAEVASEIEGLNTKDTTYNEAQNLINHDRLESLNNVMKSLARPPANIDPPQDLLKALDEAYIEGMNETIIEGARSAGRDDGQKLGKLISRGRAANHIGKALSEKYPKRWGWLGRSPTNPLNSLTTATH